MSPTYEIYAYIDNVGETLSLTDPEPVSIEENTLFDSLQRPVGKKENGEWIMPNHGTVLLIREREPKK